MTAAPKTALPDSINPRQSVLSKSLIPGMFDTYRVEVEFIADVVGGIPVNPKLIEGWIASKMKDQLDEAEQAKLAQRTLEELPQLADEKMRENNWNTFKSNGTGDAARIYIEARQVKAMFKECANILRDPLIKAEVDGKKLATKAAAKSGDIAALDAAEAASKDSKKSRYTALKSKVAEQLFVEEEPLFFYRLDASGARQYLSKPDGQREQPIHVMTPMGMRTSLKRYDYVETGARLAFTVKCLIHTVSDEALIHTILQHAEKNGLGADRSQGRGQFFVTKCDKL